MNEYYLRNYGITQQQKLDMGSTCQICGGEGFRMRDIQSKLVVDHCHTSGVIRGLLCHNCNRGLGLFQDDIKILEEALNYLKSQKGSETIRKE